MMTQARMNLSHFAFAFALAVMGVGACTGSIDNMEGPGGGGGTEGTRQRSCMAPVVLSITPMRRLTREEYKNTISDLTGIATKVTDTFEKDEALAGFASN